MLLYIQGMEKQANCDVKEIVVSKQKKNQIASKNFLNVPIIDWVLFILSICYVVSPIDLVPDVPIVGWFDDAALFMSSGLNVLQKYLGTSYELVYKILKLLKWGILILGAIAFLLVLIFGALIVSLVKG
jgi:uncharacterized membrane protein YkvA (DUF1232 family)